MGDSKKRTDKLLNHSTKVLEPKVQAIIIRLKAVEYNCRERSKEFILLRFEQGCILDEVMNEKFKEHYGAATVKEIAKELHVSFSYLYRLHTWASYFNCNKKALEQDLKGNRTATVTWYLNQFSNPDENPKAVGGKEEHEQILLKRFEDGVAAYETLKEKYPDSAETKGVEAQFVEIVKEDISEGEMLVGDPSKALPINKEPRQENEEYLEWIRTQPCVVTGSYPSDPHHLRQKKRDGHNASDLLALPFQRDVHDEYHRLGFEAFQERHKIDLRKAVLDHLFRYIIHLQSLAKL